MESNQFSQRNPAFLELLDSNAIMAMKQFENGFGRYFDSFKPRVLLRFSSEQQADLIAGLRLHCVDNHFRVLRLYKDVGKPFSHWFTLVANNYFLGELRKQRNEESIDPLVDSDGASIDPPSSTPSPMDNLLGQELLKVTMKCMEMATPKCRQLLLLAADECTPAEMTQLLHLPKEGNKKVADDLSYCREKLTKCLHNNGISASDWLDN